MTGEPRAKWTEANAVTVANSVKAKMRELSTRFPEGRDRRLLPLSVPNFHPLAGNRTELGPVLSRPAELPFVPRHDARTLREDPFR